MPGVKGRKLSAEHRAKIAAALMGHAVSETTRAKLAECAKGNQHAKGRVLSARTRAKIGAAKKGKRFKIKTPRSLEFRAAVSARLKGNKHKLGHKDRPETIERKRAAMLKRQGIVVLPSPAPGIVGRAPLYGVDRVVFFRP